jgi:hypothetical protein
MNSDTTNMEYEASLEQREELLLTREQDLEKQQRRIDNLLSEIVYLEWFRAQEARKLKHLSGLDLGDLDVDELQQLKSTIQKASERVQKALDRRKAEEAVAEGQNTFRCPIGLGLMRDPVVAADGHSYERKNIEAWFKSSQFEYHPVKSPMTNDQLNDTTLLPNHALKSVLQEAVDDKIASMRAGERAVSPPTEVDETVGTVRTC